MMRWGRFEILPRMSDGHDEAIREMREIRRRIARDLAGEWMRPIVLAWLVTACITSAAAALTFDLRTRFGHWAIVHPQLHLAMVGVSALLCTPFAGSILWGLLHYRLSVLTCCVIALCAASVLVLAYGFWLLAGRYSP
jgi:hypothetical protein